MTQLEKSNCDKTIKKKGKKTNFEKTQKLKLWQNSETEIVTKP